LERIAWSLGAHSDHDLSLPDWICRLGDNRRLGPLTKYTSEATIFLLSRLISENLTGALAREIFALQQ
jgi:hypothetical protein